MMRIAFYFSSSLVARQPRSIVFISFIPVVYKFVGGDITFNPNIDVKTFKTICEESKGVQLFDVREPRELETDGRIPGALNIPIGEVESAFGLGETDFNTKYGVPKPKATDDNIIFFCKSGGRGLRACKCIEKYGYKRYELVILFFGSTILKFKT
ncbi:unnamed protein product [Hydatigera taeniaeformis]|uniref:Rhodanese domain-containing protein n=1 Tax=Hydatigena taeniaeformis TaxID=6205 RepID=A0A0R3WKG9_HYDTA|nr:unnamed protein product [Hydatigera taeniaeformis]